MPFLSQKQLLLSQELLCKFAAEFSLDYTIDSTLMFAITRRRQYNL
jgi:hypothetical protein